MFDSKTSSPTVPAGSPPANSPITSLIKSPAPPYPTIPTQAQYNRHANEVAVNDLMERIDDWKGLNLAMFGGLVQTERFMIEKNKKERQYRVYLFERIILCCKEMPAKKSNLLISLIKKCRANNSNAAKRKDGLKLIGRVFLIHVTSVDPRPVLPGSKEFPLQVTWGGDIPEDYFTIKCPTEAQQKDWQTAITLAVHNAKCRRRLVYDKPKTRELAGHLFVLISLPAPQGACDSSD